MKYSKEARDKFYRQRDIALKKEAQKKTIRRKEAYFNSEFNRSILIQKNENNKFNRFAAKNLKNENPNTNKAKNEFYIQRDIALKKEAQKKEMRRKQANSAVNKNIPVQKNENPNTNKAKNKFYVQRYIALKRKAQKKEMRRKQANSAVNKNNNFKIASDKKFNNKNSITNKVYSVQKIEKLYNKLFIKKYKNQFLKPNTIWSTFYKVYNKPIIVKKINKVLKKANRNNLTYYKIFKKLYTGLVKKKYSELNNERILKLKNQFLRPKISWSTFSKIYDKSFIGEIENTKPNAPTNFNKQTYYKAFKKSKYKGEFIREKKSKRWLSLMHRPIVPNWFTKRADRKVYKLIKEIKPFKTKFKTAKLNIYKNFFKKQNVLKFKLLSHKNFLKLKKIHFKKIFIKLWKIYKRYYKKTYLTYTAKLIPEAHERLYEHRNFLIPYDNFKTRALNVIRKINFIINYWFKSLIPFNKLTNKYNTLDFIVKQNNFYEKISLKFFDNLLKLSKINSKVNTIDKYAKIINIKYNNLISAVVKNLSNLASQQNKISINNLLLTNFNKFYNIISTTLIKSNKKISNSNLALKNLIKLQVKYFNKKYKSSLSFNRNVINSIDNNYFWELGNKWMKQGWMFSKIRWKHIRLKKQQKRWFKWPKLYRHIRFRKLVRSSLTRFRKISKHRLFNSLLKGHFKWFMGIDERQFFYEWIPFRRIYDKPLQSGATANIVTQFTQSLNFRLSELALQFNFTSSTFRSRNIAYHNIFVLNGESKTFKAKKNVTTPLKQFQSLAFFKPRDILQINIPALHSITKNFVLGRNLILSGWSNIKKLSYLQTISSMMMVGMVFWPQDYVFKARTFYKSRWIRYWIWNLPSKSGRYLRLSKDHWNLYPKRKFNSEEKIRPVRQRR